MLRNGEYAAWFRTSRGEGTGIVHLADGRISGRDSFFNYSGSYEIEDDRFTATLKTRRYADGPTTLFGVDEVEVKLTGTVNGTIACCSGISEQAPGVHFEATLFLNQEPQEPQVKRPISAKVAKLPKKIGARYRARHPFVSER
ncbi:hypothetical protein [Bradyrhizobium sp. ARR65]|uniref:hypothetical protein n=1 Tax=Bradyrhizobium sp. ARR65 TaxID=1040989 RepID=UPI0004632BEC|nr:hypothetical protein [Bradyrhizobium sp. ARR65]